jgi:[acyl-carrier-protein] S-malonyltransferase
MSPMSATPGDLALVFPGQGSQSVGMLGALAGAWPQVGETFAQASGVLGYDLWRLCREGPAEALARTEVTQPLMLAAGVAAQRVWQAAGGAAPAWLAGHSLGEYSALVCAGTLDFADAVRLVHRRARYMQEAVPAGEGAMAAVLGLGAADVAALCEEAAAGSVLAVANYNAPGQVVVAGTAAAVERLRELARARGAKRVIPLPVSAPFHCALMAPAAERLAADLAQTAFTVPQAAVINNVDVRTERDPAAIRDALRRQVAAPVRWVEVVEALARAGVARVIECGPGGVLTGLGRRIAPQLRWTAVEDPASLSAALVS